jgi:hypothetical protein
MAEKSPLTLVIPAPVEPVPLAPPESLAAEFAAFLDGSSNGEALLRRLYGEAADEPLPPRLAEALARWRCC